MPSRYLNASEPVSSGLDAFLTGAGEAYTGVRNERRKRQVEEQQDALLRQQMEHAEMDQQRKNAEGGYTVVRTDPLTVPKVGEGIRAKIGAILGRVMGGGQEPTIQATSTLVKTGPSARETEIRMSEDAANARNAATIEGSRLTTAMREAGEDRRFNANLEETRRNNDLDYTARMAGIDAQRDASRRADDRADRDDLRTYGKQLNEEIASLTRQAADRNGIMQQVGGSENPVAAYQAVQREIRSRIGALRGELDQVNAHMNRRAIGSKLAAPAKAKAPAGVPSRAPTLEEDLQAAMQPGGVRGGGSSW